jgi:hypothetical protein
MMEVVWCFEMVEAERLMVDVGRNRDGGGQVV